MYQTINLVSENRSLARFADPQALRDFAASCGVDGLEVIRCGEDERGIVTPDQVIGVHLVFYSDWLDFWRGDEAALRRKFGSPAVVEQLYSCRDREGYIAQFRADMDYAKRMGARYVVFHVSDVSIEEGYTHRWEHTDKEVIDASCELLNLLTDGADYDFELLLENLWWPGFRFTDPAATEYMLSRAHYPKTGIMLDTGHLLHTNTALGDEAEGIAYIHRCLDAHGSLVKYVRGFHLNQSITGAYVEEALKHVPPIDPDYFKAFADSYEHIRQIDKHQPFTDPAIRGVLERVAPAYVTHELGAGSDEEKRAVTLRQRAAMGPQS